VLPLFVPAKVSPTGPRRIDWESSYQRVFSALGATEPYALPGCAPAPGKVRTWLAFEGAAPLAEHPAELREWVARGVRSVGLVHTRGNALASSSGDSPAARRGLTAAGRELVLEAQSLGVPVDVSHASDATVRDVVALARRGAAPVIATHSNARALAATPRNLSDADIVAIASTGGVIGVNFHGPFLRRNGRAELADVVRQIRYFVRLAGVDHVAIGSDFEGDIVPPRELADVSAVPRLAAALESAGLSHESVERVFGSNALRVLCGGTHAPPPH
jgi:membrane dipeptidase